MIWSQTITSSLQRIKEFSASLNGENTIPNHGFEAIERELFLLNIYIFFKYACML